MAEYIFEASNVKLNYFSNDVQSDTTMVFIHGWTGGWEVWKPVINEFNSNKIYAVDLPGHNKSDHLEIYNINTYYPPILEFVSSLNQERIIIVGHSLGSATSLYLASKLGSKITHMLLEDPPWFIEDKSQMSEHVKKETFFLEQKPKWKTVLDAIFDYQQYDPELFINNPYWATIRASYAFHHDIKIWDVEPDWIWQDAPKLSETVDAKTILLGGNTQKGGLMSKSIAEKVKNNISNCEILYWDTGHGVRSEKPKEYIQLLKNFIKKL